MQTGHPLSLSWTIDEIKVWEISQINSSQRIEIITKHFEQVWRSIVSDGVTTITPTASPTDNFKTSINVGPVTQLKGLLITTT